jgi:hypothetical protein
MAWVAWMRNGDERYGQQIGRAGIEQCKTRIEHSKSRAWRLRTEFLKRFEQLTTPQSILPAFGCFGFHRRFHV